MDRPKKYGNRRGDVKYYFADFVRKRGTPPPLRTIFLLKNRLRIWGVPPSPLYGFYFGEKGVTDLGGTPPPLTDKIRKVILEGLSYRFRYRYFPELPYRYRYRYSQKWPYRYQYRYWYISKVSIYRQSIFDIDISNRASHWTIFRAMATPVPNSLSHPIPKIKSSNLLFFKDRCAQCTLQFFSFLGGGPVAYFSGRD